MYKYLRNTNFFLMTMLFILEMVTMVLFIIILSYTFRLDTQKEAEKSAYFYNILNSCLSLVLEILGIWVILAWGMHALYFKITYRLKWYIICAILIPGMIWLFFVIDYISEKDKVRKPLGPSDIGSIINMKETIYFLGIVKSVMYILTGIFTILERQQMIKEIESSPLIAIDEFLTEELYKNILEQGLHPDDAKLQIEYRRLKTTDRSKSFDNNITHTFIDSSKSSKEGLSINDEFNSKSEKLSKIIL